MISSRLLEFWGFILGNDMKPCSSISKQNTKAVVCDLTDDKRYLRNLEKVFVGIFSISEEYKGTEKVDK